MPKYLPPASAVPLWATSPTTYPTGSFPWSGGPVRINPGSAVLAAGIAPNDQPPAQVINYQLGTASDLLSALASFGAHSALKTWSGFPITQVGTDSYFGIVGMRLARSYGTLATNDNQREVMVIGSDSGASNKTRLAHTADGTVCEYQPQRLDSIAGFTGGYWGAAAAPNELGLGNDSVQFAWTTDGGGTWNVSSGFTGTPGVVGLYYDAALGYFALGTNATVYKGTSFATLTSTAGTIATPGSSPFVGGEVDIASNGTALVIAATTAAGVAQIYYSGNAGTTWSTALALNSAARHCNVTYSEAWGQFIAWADTGEMYASADGTSWLATLTTGRTPANGFQVGRGSLVSAGYAIAKPTKISTSYNDLGGIVYSLDLGATWNYSYFADLRNLGTKIQAIRGINGRIYATALGNFYRSGILAGPSAEI